MYAGKTTHVFPSCPTYHRYYHMYLITINYYFVPIYQWLYTTTIICVYFVFDIYLYIFTHIIRMEVISVNILDTFMWLDCVCDHVSYVSSAP